MPHTFAFIDLHSWGRGGIKPLKMDPQLQQLIPKIETRLGKDDISEFKIGKSICAKERFNDEEYSGYYYLSVIAEGNPAQINQAEIDMIDYFMNSSCVKNKCANLHNGGGGNPGATELYIAAKDSELDYQDSLLGPVNLFEFQSVQF